MTFARVIPRTNLIQPYTVTTSDTKHRLHLKVIVQDCELLSADAPSQRNDHAAEESAVARLLKHADFERVYKQGRRHFSPHMTVFYLLRTDTTSPQQAVAVETGRPKSEQAISPSRVGLTVSRQLGGAVTRNRIKRRMREAVRMCRSVLAGSPDTTANSQRRAPVDIVINPKKSVLTREFSSLVEEVGRAFETIAKAINKNTTSSHLKSPC